MPVPHFGMSGQKWALSWYCSHKIIHNIVLKESWMNFIVKAVISELLEKRLCKECSTGGPSQRWYNLVTLLSCFYIIQETGIS